MNLLGSADPYDISKFHYMKLLFSISKLLFLGIDNKSLLLLQELARFNVGISIEYV